jgi:hypothetical protein
MLGKMESAYWLVRQAIVIVAFFGGLRLHECCDLALEKIVRAEDGYTITHCRVKQRRSDKLESRFLVPAEGGFAAQLGMYLEKVHNCLNVFTGRVWYTGTKTQELRKQFMGRNMVGKVPHDLAIRLELPNVDDYTFHSFRRTSASLAANGGSTSNQMQDFFGWKHPSMCQEYVSSSKPAIRNMAKKLATVDFQLGEPEVEVEDGTQLEDLRQSEELKQELEHFDFQMEDDFEMEQAAGIPPPPVSNSNSVNVQKTIETAISSLGALQGSSVKLVFITNVNGDVHI